jgi:hypothetical protein
MRSPRTCLFHSWFQSFFRVTGVDYMEGYLMCWFESVPSIVAISLVDFWVSNASRFQFRAMALPNLSSARSLTKRHSLHKTSVAPYPICCTIWHLTVVLISLMQGCYRDLTQWLIYMPQSGSLLTESISQSHCKCCPKRV